MVKNIHWVSSSVKSVYVSCLSSKSITCMFLANKGQSLLFSMENDDDEESGKIIPEEDNEDPCVTQSIRNVGGCCWVFLGLCAVSWFLGTPSAGADFDRLPP